jgi:hypothetical protein
MDTDEFMALRQLADVEPCISVAVINPTESPQTLSLQICGPRC